MRRKLQFPQGTALNEPLGPEWLEFRRSVEYGEDKGNFEIFSIQEGWVQLRKRLLHLGNC